MANVRMLVNGEEFFEFVKGAPSESTELSYFPTYAHLLCTAAAFGLYKDEFDPSPQFKEKDPRPIPLEIFKSQHLYDVLLVLAIAHSNDPIIAKDTDVLCGIIEGLAAGGFQEMQALYRECDSRQYWLETWQQAVLEAVGEEMS